MDEMDKVRLIRDFIEFIVEEKNIFICEQYIPDTIHKDPIYQPLTENEKVELGNRYLEQNGVHIPTEQEIRKLLGEHSLGKPVPNIKKGGRK